MKESIAFAAAFTKVMEHEGGYANNPDDTGGETYCGISRRFHPEWGGWLHIDSIKTKNGEIKNNTKFPILNNYVRDFYEINYWDKMKCSHITDPRLAIDVFDTAVNCGTGAAGKFLQRALNVLNNRAKYWGDLKVDGAVGAKSIQALERANFMSKAALVHTAFTVIRGAFYIDIMERRESQEQFAVTWLNRLWIKVT